MPDFSSGDIYYLKQRVQQLEDRIEKEHGFISALTRQQNEDRRDVRMLQLMAATTALLLLVALIFLGRLVSL